MMPSHLTRRVFRRLLANRPLVTHRLLHTRPPARPIPTHKPCCRHVAPASVRANSFLSLFGRQPGDPRQPTLDPGMEKMLELDKRIHLIARLPPQQELVTAFNAFIQSKIKTRAPIEDFHAAQLLQTLETLERRQDSDQSTSLDRNSLKTALQAMAVVPDLGYTDVHNKLARALWNAVVLRTAKENSNPDSQERNGIPVTLVTVLCATGDALEARSMLEILGEPPPNHSGPRAAAWAIVLAGFSTQKDEIAFQETIRMMQSLNIQFSTNVARTLAVHFARRDNVAETKRWYAMVDMSKPRSLHSGSNFTLDETVYQTLLEFCLRNDEMEWGRNVLVPTNDTSTSFNKWDAIFRASAATGRSVDEIDRMMAVMARRADESGQEELRPDVDTFNGLIRFAASKNDAYLAERYFGLMEKWGVKPTTESYCLQIEYRLVAGDLDGAIASYTLLREQDPEEDEDWTTINKLLRALVAKPGVQHSAVKSIREDLLDKGRGVPAPTALALCKYHLHLDEFAEVVILLNKFAYKFSTSQRIQIRDMMVDFTLNTQTETASAWDAYMIFHQVFDLETRREIRNSVMTFFFARGRPDLATHVFMRMSNHVRADTRPDIDTYIRAFEGIAATGETDALEVIHNLLKLDTNVEPCTRIYNSMMLAYAACNLPVRALDIWHEISTSTEGPTYNSLHIAFRVCERVPFGYRTAQKIWGKLREADIEIDKALFSSYVSCLARQRMFDDLDKELKGMKELTGEEPDANTLGSMFNACEGQTTQMHIEKYIRSSYPQIWAQLEEKGVDQKPDGSMRIRNIERALKT